MVLPNFAHSQFPRKLDTKLDGVEGRVFDFDFGHILLASSCVNNPTGSQTLQVGHSGQQTVITIITIIIAIVIMYSIIVYLCVYTYIYVYIYIYIYICNGADGRAASMMNSAMAWMDG